MRSGLVVFPLVAACSFKPPDAVVNDAVIGPPDACAMSFSHQFDTCPQTFAGDVHLTPGAYTYNTDTGTLVLGTSPQTSPTSATVATRSGSARILLVDTFELSAGASLRVEGSIPFGVAATGIILIDGVIDAGAGGAGAAPSCATGTSLNGENQSGGAGGGGGAGGQGAGGRGGDGNSDGFFASNGGTAGVPVAEPHGPTGGCPGGHGGDGEDPGGVGGVGGGSVYLVSRTQVSVSASGGINAGGGGGKGGTSNGSGDSDGGGGGGGSGGVILVEGPLTIAGILAANGGGGGQGSGEGIVGFDGFNGLLDAIQTPGGSGGGSTGTPGALGGAGGHVAGTNVGDADVGGGGGGGGSAGFVMLDSTSPQLTGVLSPVPSAL